MTAPLPTRTYIRRVQPVQAVQWAGHSMGHPLVRRCATEFEDRALFDNRDIGICQTNYGRKRIHQGDWIVTEANGAVDVIPDWQFPRLFEEVPPCAS